MEKNDRIYIIGAGVSGLIAAYELEQAGYAPTILERSGSVGGRVKTLHEKGYALDLGFQVLLSAYPMAQQYLDMEVLKLRKLESGALIYVNGQSYRIGDPLRNWKVLLPTLFANIGSIADKLKILKLNRHLQQRSINDIFTAPEQSTLEYLRAFGFSEKIITRFFRPFFAGIFLEPDLRTSSRMFEFVYKMFGEGYATIPKDGIGAISEQLKAKLKHTSIQFNQEVKEVTPREIKLASGDTLSHDGVILTGNASALLPNMKEQDVEWKYCTCLYFQVDRTNIPQETIALIADPNQLSNNLYAYMDVASGKTILSVTTLRHDGLEDDVLIQKVSAEVKAYTGASTVQYMHHYRIDQALPDIQHLRMTAQPSETKVVDNVFLAGDYLYNGSLNAAMESGRIAAVGLMQKHQAMPS
jgi:protoporphyrinogen oxidase